MKAELDSAWARRCALCTKAHELRTESRELWESATNLDVVWMKYCAFHAADKLHAEGDKLWESAVRRVCGKDATIERVKSGCIVMGIMEFNYTEEKQT